MEENTNTPIQNTVPTEKPVSKFNQILLNIKSKLGPTFNGIDTKFEKFMPNPKFRKIIYIAFASLFGFMFLIIVLGLALSPLRNTNGQQMNLFSKPKIVVGSPEPEIPLSEKQKEILKLQTEINNLKFPESQLTPPQIESKLSI